MTGCTVKMALCLITHITNTKHSFHHLLPFRKSSLRAYATILVIYMSTDRMASIVNYFMVNSTASAEILREMISEKKLPLSHS